MNEEGDHSVFNSEAQERLSALLVKAVDVVSFAADSDCDTAFNALAEFCNAALASKQERSRAKFSTMRMEELLALAGSLDTGTHVKATDARVDESEPGSEDVKVKRKREEEAPAGETPKWKFEQAYNIVNVTGIEEDPLRIVVMARPPVAGNQKPVAFIMDSDDLGCVDGQRGRNGTKLRKTLANALQEYSGLPESLVAKLKRFEWSKEIASQLEAEEE